MTKNNRDQLIRLITAQVIKKLNNKTLTGHSQNHRSATISSMPGNSNNPKVIRKCNEILIDGIVTARRLKGYDTVRLTQSSIVTPAAKDFIKENKIQVNVENSFLNQDYTESDTDNKWLFWSCCSQLNQFELPAIPKVSIKTSAVKSGTDYLLAAIRNLNHLISNGGVKGGILVVNTSAKAVYAANRYNNMRAIVGSFPKTVEDGIQQLAANVLILENTVLGQIAIAEMIKLFVISKRPLNPEFLLLMEEENL